LQSARRRNKYGAIGQGNESPGTGKLSFLQGKAPGDVIHQGFLIRKNFDNVEKKLKVTRELEDLIEFC